MSRDEEFGFFTTWELGTRGTESRIRVAGGLGATSDPEVELTVELPSGDVRVSLPADRAGELATQLLEEKARAERLVDEYG